MKILVTGGAGFIGSHLCDKYVRQGNTVVCFDNFSSGNLSNIRHLCVQRNFKLINGDIRDYDLVEKIMPGIDAVFHLAAQIHVDRSITEPNLTYEINVRGTQNILEAARIHDVRKVIYASSSEVYGSAEFVPMNEMHPLLAPHPYGASKIAADRMCYSYIKTFGMNICIMRPFNIFGPRQKDSGYGGVISLFAKRVLSGQPPIVYGSGRQTRDYTYIDDIIRAYDMVLNYDGYINEPVNFGTGVEISVVNLANMIIKLSGATNLSPAFVEPRPGEVQKLIADCSKAKTLLGWESEITLDIGLTKFVRWYKDYKFEEWTKPG